MKTRAALATLITLGLASIAVAAVPNPPQSLTATVSGSTVTLTWTAPSTGAAPEGYIVVAALSPGGTPIAVLPVANTTLVVPNVPNGVYYVHVRAVNTEGASNASSEVVVVVPGGGSGCTVPPEAPRNLAGNVSGRLVTLAWTPAPAGCAATSYVVQAGSAPGLSNIAVINVANATTLSATAPPGTYYVRVIALNAAGGSPVSVEIVLRVSSASGPVTIGFDALTTATNRSPISTYSESGFTLTTTAQSWMTLTSYGNPAPFIQFVRDATQPTQAGEVVVTAGDAPFTFTSVDVYSSTTVIPFEIIGLRGGATVFTLTGTVPNTFGGFATITNSQPNTEIDTLVIRLTNPATVGTNPVGFDNLVLRR
jgi:Fibronectin type III domain